MTRRSQSWIALAVAAISFAPALGAQASDAGVQSQKSQAVNRIATIAVPLAERSTFGQPVPNADVGSHFEALMAVHLPVYNSYVRSLDTAYQKPESAAVSSIVSVSMLANLRMTREESAPVRTPSYMPRVRFQRVWTTFQGDKVAATQSIVDFIIGHYSNGQDGCLYQGQSGADCNFAAPVDRRTLRTNRRDGSFSSHYLEAGYTHRWLRTSDEVFDDTRVRVQRVWYVGGRIRDYRALSGIEGGMTRELRSEYGEPRIRAVGGVTAECPSGIGGAGHWWLEGFIEALPGRNPQVDPVRVSLEYGRSFDRLEGIGFFLRAYRGQDDYNLGFLTNLTVVHLGIAVGGESRASFRR